jgi:hypothetical protein
VGCTMLCMCLRAAAGGIVAFGRACVRGVCRGGASSKPAGC